MSRKKQVNQKITALYCRISLDDGGDNESMSISNQKLMLKEFAEKNGIFPVALESSLSVTLLKSERIAPFISSVRLFSMKNLETDEPSLEI